MPRLAKLNLTSASPLSDEDSIADRRGLMNILLYSRCQIYSGISPAAGVRRPNGPLSSPAGQRAN